MGDISRWYIGQIFTLGVGDVISIPAYGGGFRVWIVRGVHLGAEKQEGTYHLASVDRHENKEIQVPCEILETHPGIAIVQASDAPSRHEMQAEKGI